MAVDCAMANSQYSVHPVYRSPAPIPAISAMAFSPDGNKLALGDITGRLVVISDVLDSQTRVIDTVLSLDEPITSLAWLATPARMRFADLVAGGENGFLYFVSISTTGRGLE